MNRKLLIIAYECAPYHRPASIIGAQRPYQFAKYLQNMGWQVIVLCCDANRRYILSPIKDWKPQIEQQINTKLSTWDNDSPLLIPLPSLKYADSIDQLWLNTVRINLEKGDIQPIKGKLISLKRRIATSVKIFRGDHSQSWQAVATFALKVLIQKGHVPDIQLAEHSPDASLYIACHAYKKWGIPYVVDFRDPVLQPIPSQLRSLYRYYLKKCLLRYSQAIINVNPAWVSMDKKDFNKPTFLVTNGYDADEFQGSVERPNKFTLAYLGNISFPSNLEVFFEGLQSFVESEEPKQFVFQYRGNAFEQMRRLANTYKISKWVDAQSAIPRDQAIIMMRRAHALVLFSIDKKKQKNPYLQRGYYPGKVFEYFATGNDIMTIPGDQGVLDDLLIKNNYNKIFSSADSIKSELTHKYREWQITDYKKVDRNNSAFSRSRQAEVLNDILIKVLSL